VIDETQAPDAVEAQDTPTEAAPAEGTPASSEETIDYAKRYNDLRPEFDRTKQTLSEKEQEAQAWQILATSTDPDLVQQAADILGVELEQDTDEETPDDEAEAPMTRREFQAWQQEQQAETEAKQTADAIRSHVEQIAQERGLKLTDRQRNLIFAEAVEGQISPERTVQAVDAVLGEFDSYAQSVYKPKPRVPHVTKGGQSAEQVPDLDNPEGRTDYIRERAKLLADQADQ
jgi:hypothetical protein